MIMTPDDIQGDYTCKIQVKDYRYNGKKVEYQVVVQLSFYSSRVHTTGRTSWHIWRTFSAFRKLDDQLRKRTSSLLKGVKFPPRYRRRTLFRIVQSREFLESRTQELDTYMHVITSKAQLVAFHMTAVSSQTLKTFVAFHSGFGSNAEYEQQHVHLRPSSSILASPTIVQTTSSVLSDEDDDFRSVSSLSTVSSFTSNVSEYRWSGTGFLGTQHFVRQSVPQSVVRTSLTVPRDSMIGSNRGSWFSASLKVGNTSSIDPKLDLQRAKMEDRLLQLGLVGVGMPPDGSCLLHCLVYEMYPLQCLQDYPANMTIVNVGAVDGMAPRRIAAAQYLRQQLMNYALNYSKELAQFLLQDEKEVRERFETFRDTCDEQATITELYAAASMFNLEIRLISNDESFQIDPVVPISGLPTRRDGSFRTVTFGYLIPSNGLPGHYICTREHRLGSSNSFAGGSYRGSIKIGPPKSIKCPDSRRFERISEQRME
ncbi:hypothetical protein L915_15736 [Plasmopara halstedii]|uniref:PX domain-containing protein n=1 Tax=Plasmopara halstedii TaxID=4781 RepID=A0A0N7L5B1_PLAHL|nr:hypothetical protein L915_15736 [Plasmopara halstedii]CEG40979.1 hypothetical protein L915_15736 [Plasmopara halstedii]|eukprot:XP_024577348.1 hypothetical protein L915_15736 [Plasmopara halstedii]